MSSRVLNGSEQQRSLPPPTTERGDGTEARGHFWPVTSFPPARETDRPSSALRPLLSPVALVSPGARRSSFPIYTAPPSRRRGEGREECGVRTCDTHPSIRALHKLRLTLKRKIE